MKTIRLIHCALILAVMSSAALATGDAFPEGMQLRPLQGGSIVFARGSVTRLDNGTGYSEAMGLHAYDGAPLRALQWTVINTAGKLRFLDAAPGPTIAGNPDWVFLKSLRHGALQSDLGSNDTLSFVLFGLNGAGLDPGSYDSLVTFTYATSNLNDSFLDSTHLIIADVVGSLADAGDALLTASGQCTVLVQNTVQKGDLDGNDAVDISDLIAMIDNIVGRKHLDEEAARRADIAPWPGGDSSVNVRDLVLTQNVIVTGAYPDGTPLNATAMRHTATFAPTGIPSPAPDVKLTIYVNSNGIVVQMDNGVLVKGVQLELNNIMIVPDTLRIRTSFGSGSHGLSSSIFRVLMFNDAGLPLDPGQRYISWMLFDIAKPLNVNLKKVVVADIANNAITNLQVSIVYGMPNAVDRPSVPQGVTLEQGAPNPFSTETTIAFTLPQPEAVEVCIYSSAGSRVRTLAAGTQDGGRHILEWDGRNDAGLRLPSGMYFCTLSSPRFAVMRRILFVP